MNTNSINPATGEVLASFAYTSEEKVKKIFAQARIVQKDWEAFPFSKKANALRAVRKNLVDRKEEIAKTISKENGKTLVDALATEILPAILGIGFYIKQAKKLLKKEKIKGGNIALFNKKSYLQREAWGVVGIISPWNYPFAIPFSEVVMALLMGNAVVLKLASDTQLVAQEIALCFKNAGLPDGLFSIIHIPGKQAGSLFVDEKADKLFFTGSVKVGKELMVLASKNLIPLVLELGGADAAIICEDANLDLALGGIVWAGFSNAGQSCAGVQRVLVHESIYDVFSKHLVARVKTLRLGDGKNFDVDMGPMISHKQRDTVASQVNKSIAMGAKLFAQSKMPKGKLPAKNETNYDVPFYPATVLVDCPKDSPIMSQEVFGPVLALIPFASEEEAIEIANSTNFALTASVWSCNTKKAQRLAQKINAGTVMINDHLMSHGLAETPWGGFGDSGFGKTHGRLGLEEMSRVKLVVRDTLPARKQNIFWQPYSKKMHDGINGLIDFLYAKNLKALPKTIGIFLSYFVKE